MSVCVCVCVCVLSDLTCYPSLVEGESYGVLLFNTIQINQSPDEKIVSFLSEVYVCWSCVKK